MKRMFANQQTAKAGLIVFLLTMGAIISAQAGTTGTDFNSISTTLTNWMQGSLGLSIALAAAAVGVGVGIVKQSPGTFIAGPAIGLATYYLPNILTGIVSATLGFSAIHPLIGM